MIGPALSRAPAEPDAGCPAARSEGPPIGIAQSKPTPPKQPRLQRPDGAPFEHVCAASQPVRTARRPAS